MRLSVAICTWNRARSLRVALSSLTGLADPAGASWEVVVVDNNSTDDTLLAVEEYRDVLPIRYVFEPQQGLSRARNRAVQEAGGDLIIFTDDDVRVDPSWLAEYASAAQQFPEATFFGGTIDLCFACHPPRWLRNNVGIFKTAYASRSVDPGTMIISRRQDLPFGANMGFRRSVFTTSSFSSSLGRVGGDLMSGEETEFMERLLARGDTGMWIGSAIVEHVIPQDRLTKKYVYNYFYFQGRGQVRMNRFNQTTMTEKKMKKRLAQAKRAARFTLRRDHRWAEAFRQAAVWEGRLAELTEPKRVS
jgi:glycosyltransferase involved in cell wall biosynthesis